MGVFKQSGPEVTRELCLCACMSRCGSDTGSNAPTHPTYGHGVHCLRHDLRWPVLRDDVVLCSSSTVPKTRCLFYTPQFIILSHLLPPPSSIPSPTPRQNRTRVFFCAQHLSQARAKVDCSLIKNKRKFNFFYHLPLFVFS